MKCSEMFRIEPCHEKIYVNNKGSSGQANQRRPSLMTSGIVEALFSLFIRLLEPLTGKSVAEQIGLCHTWSAK